MILDGISVKGSYHDENQDSFRVKKNDNGFVIVVSDGLGSKKRSRFGSGAACDSVVEIAEEYGDRLIDCDPKAFIREVHSRWLTKLSGETVSDCYATLLVFISCSEKGFAIRLGDGFIGYLTDDQPDVLFDKKNEYYVNETDCITEELSYDKVEIREIEVTGLNGVVICTDGVGIGNMEEEELIGFTKDFIFGYRDMPVDEITEDILSWLSDWPGADDKTMAFFVKERDCVDEATV